VNETSNSNLFFWFFPAQENPDKAPVILYVNESPGTSCLAAIFLENGPFSLNENNELVDRNSSWTKTNSMLYIDAPVGSGFSYADDDEGFAKSADDEAIEVYEALVQFFTVFKEFQPNDFYMAGLSYAGSFIPSIGHKIDAENANAAVKINLKGFLVDSPFLDIAKQADALSGHYYELGLIDDMQREEISKVEHEFQQAVAKGDYLTALSIISGVYNQKDSLFGKYTGFEELASALYTKRPVEFDRFEKFIDSKEVHNYLHVGLHQFIENNFKTFSYFIKDFLTPHIDHLQELLDKDYKVLFLCSQFNIAIAPAGVMRIVNDLKWKGASDFAKAPRKIWKSMDDVAGYVKQSGNFTFVLMRNAGSHTFHDQPEWTLELVERFTQGKGFD
jgi:vitellogenic carboxypeptidase-like protein